MKSTNKFQSRGQLISSKYVTIDQVFLDLLQSCWCLGLISTDYEQWEENREQGAAWKKNKVPSVTQSLETSCRIMTRELLLLTCKHHTPENTPRLLSLLKIPGKCDNRCCLKN